MKKTLILLCLFSSASIAQQHKQYNWHIHTGYSDSSQLESGIIGAGYSGDIFGAEFNYHILDDSANFDSDSMYEFNVEAGYKIKLKRFQLKPYGFVGLSILDGKQTNDMYFDDAYQYGVGLKSNLGVLYTDIRYNFRTINTYDPNDVNNRHGIDDEHVQFHLGVTF